MKVILVAILISAGCSQAFLAAQDAPPRGTVEGTVVNSVTGAGIGGAQVGLSPDRYTAGYGTTTDVAGRFRITGMAPGSYLIGAKKDGFGGSGPDDSFFSNSELHVASGGEPVKVELRLTPTSTMFGHVLGPDGKPAAGVEVTVNEWLMAEAPVTDEEGRFEFNGVSPGSYTLVAWPPRSAQPEQAGDGTRTAMVTTYYPSVTDLSLAQKIAFRGEGDLGDYEIRMQTAPVHRVRGTVLDEEGKPSPEAELQLIRMPDGSHPAIELASRKEGSTLFALGIRPRFGADATVVSGKDGRFEFPAVPLGDWTIEAAEDQMRAAQRDGRVSSRGASDAIVAGGDVDDLQLHLKVSLRLAPIIEWKEPGSQGASNPRPRRAPVILVSADSSELVDMEGPLYVLPGRYKAVVKPGFSAQIFLDNDEVAGQTFPLTADGPRLRVVPKTRSGTVRGMVEKGDGATVVLVPRRVEGVAFGQTVVCGAGGSFELSEVSPGDYYVAAFDRIDSRPPSAATLGLVPLRGTSVKVQEGSAANVMLSVISAPQ
jgi:protocatechuate 3,4-dioxygenase beta subunit